MRNKLKILVWGFFYLLFPDIICHKVWSIMFEKFSDNCYGALLFENIGTQFCWKLFKLEGE